MCKIPGMSGKKARTEEIEQANAEAAALAKANAVGDSASSGVIAPGVTIIGEAEGEGTISERLAGRSRANMDGRSNVADPTNGTVKTKKRVSAGLGL